MPKRRQLTAETPKDDLRNAHDRALEVISSDAELPVDGILPRDEFDWIKTFIDENPPEVHTYRERPFRVTDEQRHALLRNGVHELDIDACKNRQDLDILFSQAGQWQGSLGPCTPSKAKAIDQYMRKHTFTNSLCG